MSLADELRDDVILAVNVERARQDAKWGQQNHAPAVWLAILGEEFGEACGAVLENDVENLEEELVQVAAVAVAFVECLRRNADKVDGALWTPDELELGKVGS